ncbi:MAG TPA: hypothetical protein V6D23_17720 [Candidatus Obscuribacterales bacterium]
MNKATSGSLLIVLSLFMLMGFFRADVHGISALLAFVLTIILPGGGGAYLLYSHFTQRKQLTANKARMGLKTLEAEILKLARRSGGRLTVVEVTAEFAIDKELAEQALDSLAQQKYADYEVTESGLLVYTFHELQMLDEKSSSRRIEDA